MSKACARVVLIFCVSSSVFLAMACSGPTSGGAVTTTQQAGRFPSSEDVLRLKYHSASDTLEIFHSASAGSTAERFVARIPFEELLYHLAGTLGFPNPAEEPNAAFAKLDRDFARMTSPSKGRLAPASSAGLNNPPEETVRMLSHLSAYAMYLPKPDITRLELFNLIVENVIGGGRPGFPAKVQGLADAVLGATLMSALGMPIAKSDQAALARMLSGRP